MARPIFGPPDCAGRCIFGTCGWTTDRTAPWAGGKSSRDKLELYGRYFGCVEVDTTTYAIPAASVVQDWLAANLPPGFVFHVKLFGLLATGRCKRSQLPAAVREMMPGTEVSASSSTVRTRDMPPAALDKCWHVFNDLLRALEAGGRLGTVLFQHQNDVAPSAAARSVTEHVRRRLLPSAALAVEFRNRDWIRSDAALAETVRWLDEACGHASLVCSDDLTHELRTPDRAQRGLPPGEARQRLPLRMPAGGGPGWLYCRIHRRHGDTVERTLLPEEVDDWCASVGSAAAAGVLGQGPCYILLGTDAGDAPVLNATALSRGLGPKVSFDWASHWKAHLPKRTLAALWGSSRGAGGPPGIATSLPSACKGAVREPRDADIGISSEGESTSTPPKLPGPASVFSQLRQWRCAPDTSPCPKSMRAATTLDRGQVADAQEAADIAEALRRSLADVAPGQTARALGLPPVVCVLDVD